MNERMNDPYSVVACTKKNIKATRYSYYKNETKMTIETATREGQFFNDIAVQLNVMNE